MDALRESSLFQRVAKSNRMPVQNEHLFLHDQTDYAESGIARVVLSGVRRKAKLSLNWRANAAADQTAGATVLRGDYREHDRTTSQGQSPVRTSIDTD